MTENITTTTESGYSSIRIARKHWILLALSLIPAALLGFGDMIVNPTWQRTYAPLFHLLILLLTCFSAGKQKANKETRFLFICDAILIAVGFFHHNFLLSFLNCFLIVPMLTAMTMMNACGTIHRSPLSPAGIWETFAKSIGGVFRFIPLPFMKIFRRGKVSSNSIAIFIISIFVCIPVTLTVLLLLSSADEVFSTQFQGILITAQNLFDSPSALRIPLTIFTALMIFSWMFSLSVPTRTMQFEDIPRIPAILPSMLLPMLNMIYALFVFVQFRNLFGGAESAAMTGGYAEYARSGFFQLVAVSCINLSVLILSRKSAQNNWIRAMSALMIAFTGVILVSAFWRMRLYICSYGLTVLRVMTLWGMAAIATLTVAFTISLFRADFPLFRFSLIAFIVLWVGLNIIDIDRIIAEYNVVHYLSGALSELDTEYIRTLSPSAQSVLNRIKP